MFTKNQTKMEIIKKVVMAENYEPDGKTKAVLNEVLEGVVFAENNKEMASVLDRGWEMLADGIPSIDTCKCLSRCIALVVNN